MQATPTRVTRPKLWVVLPLKSLGSILLPGLEGTSLSLLLPDVSVAPRNSQAVQKMLRKCETSSHRQRGATAQPGPGWDKIGQRAHGEATATKGRWRLTVGETECFLGNWTCGLGWLQGWGAGRGPSETRE